MAEQTYTEVPLSAARIPQVQLVSSTSLNVNRMVKIYELFGFDCYRVELEEKLYLVTLRSGSVTPTNLAVTIKDSIVNLPTETVVYTPTALTMPHFISAGGNRELYRAFGVDYIVLLDKDNTRYLCRSEWAHAAAIVIANCGTKVAKCSVKVTQSIDNMKIKLADVLPPQDTALGLAELFGAKYVPVGVIQGREWYALDGLGKTATERTEAFRKAQQ